MSTEVPGHYPRNGRTDGRNDFGLCSGNLIAAKVFGARGVVFKPKNGLYSSRSREKGRQLTGANRWFNVVGEVVGRVRPAGQTGQKKGQDY